MTFVKDPDAKLDYSFDWSNWLDSDENILSYVITTELTNEGDSESDGIVTVWLSGGDAGTSYTVACRVSTSSGRIDERTLIIFAKER